MSLDICIEVRVIVSVSSTYRWPVLDRAAETVAVLAEVQAVKEISADDPFRRDDVLCHEVAVAVMALGRVQHLHVVRVDRHED